MNKLYTVREAAEILRVTPYSVQRYVREGKLKALKPGGGRVLRITQEELDRFLRQ